jgi:D-beta-D-heptose 7-phosphate kinase / D-beta-D-heptose 1-phosphate adenosyltransferase
MSNYDYNNFLKLLSTKKILCVGDLILDKFIDNEIIKISDEDPINVIKEKKSHYKLGGVGNVALNLLNSGVNVKLISIGSTDKDSKILTNLLKEKKIDNRIFLNKEKITTVKERFYVGNYHLIRSDKENNLLISKKLSDKIIDYITKLLNNYDYDALLISDYSKGFITDYFFNQLSLKAKKFKIRIFTDPKSINFKMYDGTYVLKCNKKEMNDYLFKFGLKIDHIDFYDNNNLRKIKKVLSNLKINYFIITRSEKSTILLQNNKSSKFVYLPVNTRDVVNTTGAGDTFFSYFVLNYIINKKMNVAIQFAHLFSRFSVNKFGTYAPTFSEIFLNILNIKIINYATDKLILSKIISDLKSKNITIGFANGCFDILHTGHIGFLKKAKSMCDFLIIGINNDQSVRLNKGKTRPYNNIETRSLIISSLSFVDFVIIFNEKTPLNLIKSVKPKFIFKGSDYKLKQVVGYDIVKKNNGKIIIIENYKKYSTTNIINKLI